MSTVSEVENEVENSETEDGIAEIAVFDNLVFTFIGALVQTRSQKMALQKSLSSTTWFSLSLVPWFRLGARRWHCRNRCFRQPGFHFHWCLGSDSEPEDGIAEIDVFDNLVFTFTGALLHFLLLVIESLFDLSQQNL